MKSQVSFVWADHVIITVLRGSDLLISVRVVFLPELDRSLHTHCRLVPLQVGQSVKPTSHWQLLSAPPLKEKTCQWIILLG